MSTVFRWPVIEANPDCLHVLERVTVTASVIVSCVHCAGTFGAIVGEVFD